jgi:serine/threonine protein phosphatase PrpC
MIRLKMITPEQAVDHPARNQLSRAVGTNLTVRVDMCRERLEPGDTFVLCSDGLWSDVSDAELTDVAADALVDLALSRQAADNVTAVVVHVPSGLPIPAAAVRRRPWFLRGRTP